ENVPDPVDHDDMLRAAGKQPRSNQWPSTGSVSSSPDGGLAAGAAIRTSWTTPTPSDPAHRGGGEHARQDELPEQMKPPQVTLWHEPDVIAGACGGTRRLPGGLAEPSTPGVRQPWSANPVAGLREALDAVVRWPGPRCG